MKRPEPSLQRFLDQSFERFRKLPAERVELACERVLERLRDDTAVEAPLADCASVRWAGGFSSTRFRSMSVAGAAAIVLVVFMTAAIVRNVTGRNGTYAVVEAGDRSLFRISGDKTNPLPVGQRVRTGETVRSNGASGAMLVLTDGSRIEMRSKSELSLQTVEDGVLIQLNGGSIIVTAAKQRNGHLYVRTKDVTVSVVGTVFMVNAEEAGSRVAVIQGEVRVQQGATDTKLSPGQQVATFPVVQPEPMGIEISWSRNAEAHLALLHQTITERPQAPGPPSAEPPRLEFAAASIKPLDRAVSFELAGFVCRGTDGIRRMYWEHRGESERLTAPQGRCIGNRVLLSQLIAYAYGVGGDQLVLGGPGWVRADSAGGIGEPISFKIEAVADDPSRATASQMMQMVRTMIEDRFKLKFHRETQESPGYALVVAKNGPKAGLRAVSNMEEVPPANDFNDKGQMATTGRSTLDRFARWLREVSQGMMPVVDRTGLKGVYEYEIIRRIAGGGLLSDVEASAQPSAPTSLDDQGTAMAAAWSAMLEEQLGLRLQAEKAVPVEILVIDHVEKPSPD